MAGDFRVVGRGPRAGIKVAHVGSVFLSLARIPMKRIVPVIAGLAVGSAGERRKRDPLRHLDGRHSADHRPAGSRRGRLSVHRLHDLRSAGRLGDGRRGSSRQADPGPRHRMDGRSGRPEEMALQAARGRQIPRRQRVQRRRRGVESRQGAGREGAAFRQAPERAGAHAPAVGRELEEARRHDGRDHHQGSRTRSSRTRCSGS